MFTGLVQAVGTVISTRPSGQGQVITIELGKLASEAGLGDSVAVNGVCLTVTRLSQAIADFDVSGETLSKTIISELKSGSKVNLELAMSAQGRFGGHIVQGHVDGIAKVKSVQNKGDFYDVSFTCPKDLLKCMIPKGSVAINGISLTIARKDADSFTVAIIPVTWQETNLSLAKPGDNVNIETDIIVKVITQQLQNMLEDETPGGLTLEKLRSLGF